MTNTNEILTFSIPLTVSNFDQAYQFSEKQLDPYKKRQVFLNTLAVQVVNYYCQCLGVDTEIAQGNSWNWVNHIFLNVADLMLSKGDRLKLECRPILPDEDYCDIPLEVQSNRIAYLVVEIDEPEKKATILGFTNQINRDQLCRSQLKSLDYFIVFMQRFVLPTRDYLEQLFQQGNWKNTEEVVVSSYRRRRTYIKEKQQVFSKVNIIEVAERRILLIVHLKKEHFPKVNFSLRIYPQILNKNDPNTLPFGVTMLLLDSQGLILREKVTQPGDNCLRLGCQLPDDHQIIIKIINSQKEIIKKLGSN